MEQTNVQSRDRMEVEEARVVDAVEIKPAPAESKNSDYNVWQRAGAAVGAVALSIALAVAHAPKVSAEAPVNGMEQRYDNSAGAIAGYTQQANDYATLNMEHTTNATNYAAEAKKPNYTVEAKAAYANAATVSTSLAAKANQISLAYMAAVNAVRNGGNVDAAMKVVGDLCDEYSLLMVELNGIKFPVFKEKPTEEDRPKETTTEPTKPTEVVTTTTTTTTTQPPTTTNYPTTYPPGPNVPVKTDSEKERYQKIMSGAFGGAALMGAAGYALWASANRKEKRKIIAAINEAEGTGGSK